MKTIDKVKQGAIRFYNYITGKWDTTTPKQWERFGKSALKMAEVKEKDRQRKRSGKGKPRIKPIQSPLKPRQKTDTVKYKDFFTGEEKTTTAKQWKRYKTAESLSVENLLKKLRKEINKTKDTQLKKGLEQAKKVIEKNRKEKNFDILKNVPEYIQKIRDYYNDSKPSQEDYEEDEEPTRQRKDREKTENQNTDLNHPENRFGAPTNQWQQYLYDLLIYAYNHGLPIYANFEFTSEHINELISQVESDRDSQGVVNDYIDKSAGANPTTRDDIAEYL
jgi:hypothetical protein